MSDDQAAQTPAGPPIDNDQAIDVFVDIDRDASAVEPEVGTDGTDPSQPPEPMAPELLRSAIEAILFVVDSPLTVAVLASALQRPVAEVERAVTALGVSYDERAAGIELREVAGGVRIYTRPDVAAYVEQFLQDGQRSRLSQAALETLAVIAYRQPVTRARVSAIRGVNVDGVVRTLLSRGLIVEVGSDPETGGGLYKTSELFLERMGMQTLEELPSLAPLVPELDTLEYDQL